MKRGRGPSSRGPGRSLAEGSKRATALVDGRCARASPLIVTRGAESTDTEPVQSRERNAVRSATAAAADYLAASVLRASRSRTRLAHALASGSPSTFAASSYAALCSTKMRTSRRASREPAYLRARKRLIRSATRRAYSARRTCSTRALAMPDVSTPDHTKPTPRPAPPSRTAPFAFLALPKSCGACAPSPASRGCLRSSTARPSARGAAHRRGP